MTRTHRWADRGGMNTPGRLAVRVLALAAAAGTAPLVRHVAGVSAIELQVVLTLGPVAIVGAFLDARRAGLHAAVGLWAAAGATLGLVLGVSAPLRNGDWREGVELGGMVADLVVAVPLLAVLVTFPALVGGAIGSAARARDVSRG